MIIRHDFGRTNCWQSGRSSHLLNFVPELVIEIGSKGTRKRDETIKRRLYERAGGESTGSSIRTLTRSECSVGWATHSGDRSNRRLKPVICSKRRSCQVSRFRPRGSSG